MPISKFQVHRGCGTAHAQIRCYPETKSKVRPKKKKRPGRGVRHGASRRTRFRNPLHFTWISDSDWISKWISGFHVDFWILKWISTFWILFEELLFVILKILLINKPSQPRCTQNTMSQALHSSSRRTAYCVHNWGEPERAPH